MAVWKKKELDVTCFLLPAGQADFTLTTDGTLGWKFSSLAFEKSLVLYVIFDQECRQACLIPNQNLPASDP